MGIDELTPETALNVLEKLLGGNAEALIGCLAWLAGKKVETPPELYRSLVKSFAVRLAARVVRDELCKENADAQTQER